MIMSEKFIEEMIKKSLFYHRFIYIFQIIYIVYLNLAGMGLSNGFTYLSVGVILGSWMIDKIYHTNRKKVKRKSVSIKCAIQISLFSACMYYPNVTVMAYIPFLVFSLVLIFEDTIFNNIYDDYNIMVRRVIYIVLLSAGAIGSFLDFSDATKAFGGFALSVIASVTILYVLHLFSESIGELDKKANEYYFDKMSLDEDRKKLIVFQDRVKSVNDEINLQKINLMKANSNLENMNKEVRSLIEVMKEFSSSFDVRKNVRKMMENILDVKNAGMCGMFINKDVFYNKEPFMDIIGQNEENQVALRADFEKLYNIVRDRKSPNPIVLINNMDYKEKFIKGTNICNAIAFPAYENDHYYGVMVVASNKYDFFESGYSFYESSLMDFTTALRSVRLYLQMEDMARKDGLTSIYNRAYFNESYKKIVKNVLDEKLRLTVALMDIDKFKSINDTYGHLAGDEVIKMVAGMDNKYAENNGGIAVRYGGEEFLMILTGKGLDESIEILKEMHKEIRTTKVKYDNLSIDINTSVGVASYPDTTTNIDEVLDRADRAMYYSKEHGRGHIVIDGKEEESYNNIQDL